MVNQRFLCNIRQTFRFSRKLRFRCQRIRRSRFCLLDKIRYTVSTDLEVYALWRQISRLSAPPRNRLFVNLPNSGRQVTRPNQGLSTGRRERTWERGWCLLCMFNMHFSVKRTKSIDRSYNSYILNFLEFADSFILV